MSSAAFTRDLPLPVQAALQGFCGGNGIEAAAAFHPQACTECVFDPALIELTSFKRPLVARDRVEIARFVSALRGLFRLTTVQHTTMLHVDNAVATSHDWTIALRDHGLDVSGRSSCLWVLDKDLKRIKALKIASHVISSLPNKLSLEL